jgi:hypothetical protein
MSTCRTFHFKKTLILICMLLGTDINRSESKGYRPHLEAGIWGLHS